MSARRSSALSRIPAPLLVFIGGGVGSLCRLYTPSYIYVANVLGAFALGVLTAWWSRRAARYGDEAVRPQRLLFGTGLLGGYTTYAALIAALNIFDEHNGTGDALIARLVWAECGSSPRSMLSLYASTVFRTDASETAGYFPKASSRLLPCRV